MSMNKFEKIQQEILDSTGKNQLVSAGAGSGKTTVMIEKIANLILKDKVDIDSILVVTFTVLAAEEMKDRLNKKLISELDNTEDKKCILSIMEKLKTASIDTIDGFSSKAIKKYFYELNISPNIEIISDSTRDYYLSKAMKMTFDEFEKTDMINMLLDFYGGNRRNLENLKELVLNTFYNVINIEDYNQFLVDAENEYVDSRKSEYVVNEYLNRKVFNLSRLIKNEMQDWNSNIKESLKNFVFELDKINKSWSLKTNLIYFNGLNYPKFSIKELRENSGLKDVKNAIKELEDIHLDFEKNGINDNFDLKNSEILVYFQYFLKILRKFIYNYNTLKEKNNLLDFNDLNRLMLKLLEIKNIKAELNDKYKYVFVDEYQDVNPLQDSLISQLVGENTKLFVVGDVKQSIYGFRGASPEGFSSKYISYKSNNKLGNAFDMNINFRSNPIVLNFINEVFSNLMTKENGDIDYIKDALIEPKRDDILDDKVKILLVSNEKDTEIDSGLYSVKNDKSQNMNNYTDVKIKEAVLVLQTITELIKTEFYDANLREYRKLRYSDIAILSRSEKDENAQLLISLLKENSIPLNINSKLEANKNECLKLILSILKCITGRGDSVDYLATFLALTELTIDDLIKIRDFNSDFIENLRLNANNEKIKAGFDILEKIKNASFTKTNSELIRFILNDCRLKYYILIKENGMRELGLIEEFLNKITALEDGLNLCEFIDIVENSVGGGSDFASIDNENSVTIQTIHKSKGLEYPVVILYNASKTFSYLRENDSINFNSDIGLGMDYFDVANRTKAYGLVKYAINLKNLDKGYKEELRLLYVAMTRAKNKLIITGQYSPKLFEDAQIKKSSYVNMLLSCYIDRIQEGENQFKNCEINFYDNLEISNEKSSTEEKKVEWINQDYIYPNQDKFNISLKNTVTGLNSELSQTKKFSTKQWLNPITQYSADDDRAIIGTHYHAALEKLDFSKPYVKNTDFDDVDYKYIEMAYNVISKLTNDAKNIKKEAEFMMYVPYNEIVDSKIGDKVLVQGVVDLIIEYNDYITIVDYKFSRLNIKTLKEKYSEQLSLYKKAVESAFNKKVEHIYIYSILTGELL